jgi:hypothetical protein
MSIKYTRTTLEKVEKLYEELEYKVRYEKGSFQSGYCLVESRKIAVINKFFDVKGRISVLLDILSTLSYDFNNLSEGSQKLLQDCGLAQLSLEAA